MPVADYDFPRSYEVNVIDAPGDGVVDYSFGNGNRSVNWLFLPFSGGDWTGSFSAEDPGMRAFSGVCGTPSARWACVIERGTAFLVDVESPDRFSVVPTRGPVTAVVAVKDQQCLLLVTRWAISAVGADGYRWTSKRIAVEDVRIDEAEGGWVRGVGDPDDEPHDFAVHLRSGRLVGGAGIL